MTIRVVRDEQKTYIMVEKSFLLDPNLSLKTKGLWAYLQCFPDNRYLSVSELSTELNELQTTISIIIDDLIEAKYLKEASNE